MQDEYEHKRYEVPYDLQFEPTIWAKREGAYYDYATGQEITKEQYEAELEVVRKQYWRRTKEWAERLWEDLRDW